jgi:hypothetical protein
MLLLLVDRDWDSAATPNVSPINKKKRRFIGFQDIDDGRILPQPLDLPLPG